MLDTDALSSGITFRRSAPAATEPSVSVNPGVPSGVIVVLNGDDGSYGRGEASAFAIN